MKREVFLSIVALAASVASITCPRGVGAQESAAITLRLWPGTAPGAAATAPSETRDFPASAWVAGKPVLILGNVSQPALTFYPPLPGGAAKGRVDVNGYPVVIVFPGGGYNILAYDLEGTEVCDWLNRFGTACVVVKYRVPNTGPYPKSDAALQDAQRAVGLVRQHAAEWKIDAKRVAVLGFSAGGHLAAALTSHSAERLYPAVDAADSLSCRPDLQLLIYPAYLSETDGSLDLSASVQPPAGAPATFLIQAEDDPVHVENAMAYFEALKRKGIPAEMHLYARGGHGYGLRSTRLPVAAWREDAERWLDTKGFTSK